jgi:hypothetical protein
MAEAAVTTTATISPRASTARPRLRPGTFFAASLPVVAAGPWLAARSDWVSTTTAVGPPRGRPSPAPGSAASRGSPDRCRPRARGRSSSRSRTSAAGHAAGTPTDSRSGSGRRSRSRSPAAHSGPDGPTPTGAGPSTLPGTARPPPTAHRSDHSDTPLGCPRPAQRDPDPAGITTARTSRHRARRTTRHSRNAFSSRTGRSLTSGAAWLGGCR